MLALLALAVSAHAAPTCAEVADALTRAHTAELEDRGARWLPASFRVEPMAASDEGVSAVPAQDGAIAEEQRLQIDGENIVAVFGRELLVLTRSGDERGRVTLEGEASGIFLTERSVWVLQRVGSDAVWLQVAVDGEGPPSLVRRVQTSGVPRTARIVDGHLLWVTQTRVDWPTLKRHWSPADDPSAWLPVASVASSTDSAWQAESATRRGCDAFTLSDRVSGPTLSHVWTLDLARPEVGPEVHSVQGWADDIAVSDEHVWLTAPLDHDSVPHTRIAAVTLADGVLAGGPEGAVRGVLPHRLALDERHGLLRVATEAERPRLSVFRVGDAELIPVGMTEEFPGNERLMAARFAEDRVWMVTMIERRDPLWDVSLTDPAHPTVTAGLALPGWMDLLLPIDEGRLLAAGVDPDDGELRPSLSLLDVRDPSAPVLGDRVRLPGRDTPGREALGAWSWRASDSTGTLLSRSGQQVEVFSVEGNALRWRAQVRTSPEIGRLRAAVLLDDAVLAVGERGLLRQPLDGERTVWVAGAPPGS